MPPPPPDVRAWDYLGCLELAVGEWNGAGADTSAAARPAPALPEVLMLFPDAFDEWGREYSTYRAIAHDPAPPGGADIPYRWFTRADTLWLVWSDGEGRGGIALREAGASLSGLGALLRRGEEATLEAPVTAWRVNCHTLAREGRGRRR